MAHSSRCYKSAHAKLLSRYYSPTCPRDITDILPPLKGVGFCFSSVSVLISHDWSGFRRTILSSFSVPIIHRVAPLGVSVRPSTTSLSAADRDTSLPVFALDEKAKRFLILARDFMWKYNMRFSRRLTHETFHTQSHSSHP